MLAADISLQEKPEAKTLFERNREAVNERLRELGLVRCDTIGDGNCQFVALAFSSDKGVDQAIQGENYIYNICSIGIRVDFEAIPFADKYNFPVLMMSQR